MEGVSPQGDAVGPGSRKRKNRQRGVVLNIGLAGRMPEEGGRLSSLLTKRRAPGRSRAGGSEAEAPPPLLARSIVKPRAEVLSS